MELEFGLRKIINWKNHLWRILVVKLFSCKSVEILCDLLTFLVYFHLEINSDNSTGFTYSACLVCISYFSNTQYTLLKTTCVTNVWHLTERLKNNNIVFCNTKLFTSHFLYIYGLLFFYMLLVILSLKFKTYVLWTFLLLFI